MIQLPSDDISPIFIGGLHRSGTSLMQVMLNRHPAVASGAEGRLLERTSFLDFHGYLEDTCMPQLARYGFGQRELDAAIAAFVNTFFARYQAQRGKQRWADKTTKNILRIDYLFRLFPHAQFIHMIRDPRDAHCSVRTKAETRTPHWKDFTADQTANAWVARIQSGLRWRDDTARYLEVRYEQLVEDPVPTMQHVLQFLREPWDAAVLMPNEQTDTVYKSASRPIFSSSVGRWRADLRESDLVQIEAIAGPLMNALGYVPVTTPESRTEPDAD